MDLLFLKVVVRVIVIILSFSNDPISYFVKTRIFKGKE